MKVREAMARTISTAAPGDTLRTVAQLMKKEDAGFMPVVDNGKIVGVITDRDIVLRALADGDGDIAGQPVERCMTRSVKTIQADADIEDAARMMNDAEIRRLAVCEGEKLVGVLSHGNLVQATRSEGAGDTATLGVTRGA